MGDKVVEQVDDVVVVDKGVGERHEGPADGLFTIGLAHDNSFPGCRIGLGHVGGEHQPSSDDVAGDVNQQPLVDERVRAAGRRARRWR